MYTPLKSDIIYYRLKVTSTINQVVYSNTIALKVDAKTTASFSVSTVVRSLATVTAAVDYAYQLSDINGNTIAKGKGKQGYNQIDMNNQPAGMYILQLLSNNQKQTERIIKQ